MPKTPRRRAARTKMGKRYVTRDSKGRIKSSVSIGRSLAADRRKHAKKKVKPGFGGKGDIKIGW